MPLSNAPDVLTRVRARSALPSLQELYRISIPIAFNEPISILQRISEFFEYAHLLRLADRAENVVDRMEVRSYAMFDCA